MVQRTTKVERDEFDAWLDHPVTRWVLGAFTEQADIIKGNWVNWAWDSNILDPQTKTREHTRWDILNQIGALNYETACEYAGEQEEHNDADDN